jgi:hypothetical protein
VLWVASRATHSTSAASWSVSATKSR